MEMEQELPLEPSSNVTRNLYSNHRIMSHLLIRLLLVASTVKSILGLIILFLLFVLSTGVFTVGFCFRNSRHCSIEPRISSFLMIAGGLSMEWTILSLILSIIIIVRKSIQSLTLITFIILIALIIIITNIFLAIWAIFGSIWVSNALESIQYTNFDDNAYCRNILYQFTLGYLVVTYIHCALQCWYRLCNVIFCSTRK